MKRLSTVPVAIFAALLLACLVAVYVTRDSSELQVVKAPAGDQSGALDFHLDYELLSTANQMAALAETADEQDAARRALRLADHEVDQGFATALRQAAAYRPPATGPLRDLIDRVDRMKFQITVEQTRIAQLAKETSANAATQVEVAKAQLALDQDDLLDAQQDLARQGGDPHAAIERALQEHDAAGHQTTQTPKGTSSTATLVEQVRTWFALASVNRQLLAAAQQAANKQKTLADRHNQLEKQTNLSRKPPELRRKRSRDSIGNRSRERH